MTTETMMTADQVAELWYEAAELSYAEEPTDRYAQCDNCGVQYKSHDEYDCFGDDDDELPEGLDEDEWYGFEAPSIAYLNTDDLESGELTATFITAYEASKHIPVSDMPAYEGINREHPWNALNDCLTEEFPEGTDMKAIHAAFEWVQAWKECKN